MDISWEMVEDDENESTTTFNSENYPKPSWTGTPFELIRIFVKCLSDKSSYGHAASTYASALLEQKAFQAISHMGRIVGTRSLQRLKDAMTVFRTTDAVLKFFEALHKVKGVDGGKGLNKLDIAVRDGLKCPFNAMGLVSMESCTSQSSPQCFFF